MAISQLIGVKNQWLHSAVPSVQKQNEKIGGGGWEYTKKELEKKTS